MRQLLLGALILSLLVVTAVRNGTWRSDDLIWNDTISKSPRKARAYNEYGLQQLNTGKTGQAYLLIRKALELEPFQIQSYINLGLVYEKLDQTENAIKIYGKAVWAAPNDPTAYYNLGVLYFNMLNDHPTALTYFLKARDLDPREPDVHEFLARIFAEQGDAARAAEEEALNRKWRR
jgi:Flp pilus assembly protein TadD